MSLYKQWNEEIENIKTEEQYKLFWTDYMTKEAECYKGILQSKNPKIQGTYKELADNYGIEPKHFIGFLDGANTSFLEALDLESLDEASYIDVEFDFERLLWNMHEAKADWLYNLDEWHNIFDEVQIKEIAKKFNRSKMATSTKIGRNEPCPCGSEKK